MAQAGKVVAAICLAPVILAYAGVLNRRQATVAGTEATTIEAQGAHYTGPGVTVDASIVTNHQLASLRIRIEHVISSIKRCRMIKDPCRLHGVLAQDRVMEIACALHNFRLFISPCSPLIKSE